MLSSRTIKLLLFLLLTCFLCYLYRSNLDTKVTVFLKWYKKYSINSRIDSNDPNFVKSEVAQQFSELGSSLNKTGEYEEALESYKYALSIQRKLHANDQNKEITDLLRIMGELGIRMEKYNESINYFNQLLTANRNKFGGDMNENVAETMLQIADTYYSMRDYNEASHLYKEVKSIYQRLNFDHSDDRFNGKLMEIEQALVLSDLFKKNTIDNNSSTNNKEL